MTEQKWYHLWTKLGLFEAKPNSNKPKFSLLVPPPNLTGELHLGHAMQHAILDAIARFKRLQGFDVLLLPGVDHAGIQFEATFEKKLEKQHLSKEKLGREAWLKKAFEFKDEIYKSVSKDWRFMGLSADWSKEVFTLDDGPKRAVFEAFKTFWEAGLIYKGPYIVQWCPRCNTAIEDVEMEYEEREEKLYYVKYLIEGTQDQYIAIATARPETIFADTGIAVYPNHPQFSRFVGLRAHIPLAPIISEAIPIFEDERVEKDFGTGALKVTPGHDLLDYQIGKDHNLPIRQVIDKNGRITKLAGEKGRHFGRQIFGLEGLTVEQARVATEKLLKLNKALIKTEKYTHSVAVCERCKSVVEPLISEEWFIKMDSLAKDAIKAIKAGKINFLPKNYAQILIDWLTNIHDWCISRSLWWGHRIPVWYQKTSHQNNSQPQKTASIPMKVAITSPGPNWVQDEQVLDTWFSSGLWPLSTLGWPYYSQAKRTSRQKPKLNPKLINYFPWDFEISAPEIKYLWIARMIMLNLYFTGQIPFKTMFFHGMLRDLQGRKFSKSLGNGIEPAYLINKWGVDATRMALYTYAIAGRDGRVSKEIMDERAKNFRNFATKIRNIARFVIDLKPTPNHLRHINVLVDKITHPDDQWILAKLDQTIKKVTRHLERLEIHLAVNTLYNFIWHELADVYLEKSKLRRTDAQPVLEHVLKKALILLHPFMPFLTEEIYQKFDQKQKSIMIESWPSSRSMSKV